MRGEARGNVSERIGQSTGEALAKVYQPDRAADDQLDRLIDQLGQVPWSSSKTAETKQ